MWIKHKFLPHVGNNGNHILHSPRATKGVTPFSMEKLAYWLLFFLILHSPFSEKVWQPLLRSTLEWFVVLVAIWTCWIGGFRTDLLHTSRQRTGMQACMKSWITTSLNAQLLMQGLKLKTGSKLKLIWGLQSCILLTYSLQDWWLCRKLCNVTCLHLCRLKLGIGVW